MRSSFPPGFLAFFFLILLLVLMPFLFVNIFFSALGKLGLTPVQSLFVVIGIFLGSTINIPVKRYQRDEAVETSRRTMYGLGRSFFIDLGRPQTVVLAVNVGGCIIPSCIAILQVYRLTQTGGNALLFCGIATLINIIVCQIFARPVENLGIVMPTFIPALAAVASALILTPNHAPA
ncbi:MAG TPA: DUF1614 domain-containing protein, partial [Balneolaceae bacterium]|nr:DUF1614 domain-containing protein [Balneolaceae bacterium]